MKLSAAAASGGLSVSLASNNAAVKVPATVTVPANATSAAFTATVSSVTTAQAVVLTAKQGSISEIFGLKLNAATPTLHISATSVAFGSVATNTVATPQVVYLASTGTVPVTISAEAITGAGFTMSGANFPITLTPGLTAELSVKFDPTTSGAATGQLTVTSNSSTNGKAVISLTGTGMATAATLSAVSCGSGSITGSGTDACTVKLTAAAASSGLSVSLASSNAAVKVPASVTVPANATSAAFTATVSSVTSAQAATLTAKAGSVTESFNLQLNATVPTLTINATSVAFGDVVVNTPATQSVILTSTGTAPVTISAAAVTGTGFTMSGTTFPVTLNAGQTATLSVQFDPTTATAATGQLTITSNSSTNGKAVISLSGTGEAGSYEVTVSWSAPSSTAVSVAGYQVYRAPGGSSTFKPLNSSVDSQTTYTDATIQGGQSYEYYIESVDSAGVSSAPSNTFSVTVP